MSRRHTSNREPRLQFRMVGFAIILLVALTAALPSAALAQDQKIRSQDIEQRWQLLEYRDPNGDIQTVPAGIGATVQLFSGRVWGEGACSEYESGYTQSKESLFIDPPEIQYLDCDAASQSFDDAFYRGLADTATVSVSDSILTLRDLIGEPVMTLTRAVIPADPTIARWELARIGTADGSIVPVIQGVDPWIEFLRGGRLVGSTGCGSFLGSYTTNDGTIRITDVDYRLADCTEALQAQAEDVIGTLDEVTDFKVLPAGMTLRDTTASVRLALTPAIDLGRRTWTPVEIIDINGDVVVGADRLNTSAVRFARDDADGRTICRGFNADSLRSGLALSTFNVELAGKRCPGSKKKALPLQEIENAFVEALQQASSHALRGSELELMDVQGRPLMRLTPQAELVGPSWVLTKMDVRPNARRSRIRDVTGVTPITATFEDIDVVIGETGAADRSGENTYVASYRTPRAAQITIWDATVDGRACSTRKRRGTAMCKQQAAFLNLLQSVDSYIVRDRDLRLFKGTRAVLFFVPETGEGEAP
jgi:heat shock protein HslJ